jgi:nitrate/nitrite transporter NarK
MIAIAFANATLRQLVFIKHFKELQAHQLSTCTLIILCSIYVWFIFPLLNIQYPKQAALTGGIWVVLTVIFEFSLGLLVNRSPTSLLQDYNLLAGRLWLLFLFYLFALPYVCYIIRNG